MLYLFFEVYLLSDYMICIEEAKVEMQRLGFSDYNEYLDYLDFKRIKEIRKAPR